MFRSSVRSTRAISTTHGRENSRATGCTGSGANSGSEWLEPADIALECDKIPSGCSFVVDPSGLHMKADDLDADVGRWLWFRPDISRQCSRAQELHLLVHRRNRQPRPLSGVQCSLRTDQLQQLINVYAYDVARLPEWHRRFWRALMSVLRAGLALNYCLLNPEQCRDTGSGSLVGTNHRVPKPAKLGRRIVSRASGNKPILRNTHRFRALDENGLFALAKDVNRLQPSASAPPQTKKIAGP